MFLSKTQGQFNSTNMFLIETIFSAYLDTLKVQGFCFKSIWAHVPVVFIPKNSSNVLWVLDIPANLYLSHDWRNA